MLSLNHFHLVLKCKRFKISVCILRIFCLRIDTCLHLHTQVCVCSIWNSVTALVLLGHEVCTELWPCHTSAVTGALGCRSGKPPVVCSHTFCVALTWVRGKLIRNSVSVQMQVSTAGGKTLKYFHVTVSKRVLSHFIPTLLAENA